jgi:hypothetical protein
MRKNLHLLLTLLAFTAFSIPAFAQPVNDECENAIPITSGTHDFTTLEATTGDSGAYPATCPAGGGSSSDSLYNDVWFIYTADFTGLAEFSTCGTADYDTNVAIYQGSSCPPSPDDVIACNEDGVTPDGQDCANFTSRVTWEVEEGSVYIIQIGGWGSESPGEEGSGTFTIEETMPVTGPPNDECENATPLDLGPQDSIVLQFNTVEASTGLPRHEVPQSCFEPGEEFVYNDIWYSWTATYTGGLEFSTCGTATFDSRLAVYQSTTCPPDTSTLVGCGDDENADSGAPCGGFTSRALFNVEQGQSYLFRLGGWSSGDRGAGSVLIKRIEPVVPPANDDCANALNAFVISQEQADNFDFIFEGTNKLSTGQPQFATPICNNDGDFRDVWYTFNSGENTELTLRFNKTTTNAEFIIDLFETCGIQADPLDGPYFCIETEDFDNTFLEVPLENFPGEPTEYLIRVSTRLTGGDLPGDFWFQLVGTPFSSLEALQLGAFRFFPNPVRNAATMSFKAQESLNLQAEITNSLGQTIQRLNFGQIPSGDHTFDVPTEGLQPGIYFLRLFADGAQKTVRFIKQ